MLFKHVLNAKVGFTVCSGIDRFCSPRRLETCLWKKHKTPAHDLRCSQSTQSKYTTSS